MDTNVRCDFFGMPIDEQKRQKGISSLKSLAKLLRDQRKTKNEIATFRRGIGEAEAEVRKAKGSVQAENAEKRARKYAEDVQSQASDSRVLFKNRALLVLWLAVFGYFVIGQVFPKAFPAMQVERDISHYVCLIIAYGVAGLGTLFCLLGETYIDKKVNPLMYLVPAVVVTLIAAVPMGIFCGTIATNSSSFEMPVGEILGYCIPPVAVCAAVLFISGLLDIPLSALKPSKGQLAAYEKAYNEEYSRITKENNEKTVSHNKKLSESNQRLSKLTSKLEEAERELSRIETALDNADFLPEYYKEEDTVSALLSSLETSFAGSVFVAVRLFEQRKAQEKLVMIKDSASKAAAAKEDNAYTEKFMTAKLHDSQYTERDIAEIRRKIKQNNDMANDIYRACGSDKRV